MNDLYWQYNETQLTLYRKRNNESQFALLRSISQKVLKSGSVVRRLWIGRPSSHSYSPQKVRPEDRGERRMMGERGRERGREVEAGGERTSNSPVGIPVEFHSWNLLLHVDRNRRCCGGGWHQTRPFSRGSNSRSDRNGREYWFQPVHRHRVNFISNLEVQNISL